MSEKFKVGDDVECNGYPGKVLTTFPEGDQLHGMVEVRLKAGVVCVSEDDRSLKASVR